MRQLGQHIKTYRANTNTTLRMFEEKSGVSRTTINALEKGEDRKIDLTSYTGIAEALNLPLWKVLELDGYETGLTNETHGQLQRLVSMADHRTDVKQLLEELAEAEEPDVIAILNYLRVSRSQQ